MLQLHSICLHSDVIYDVSFVFKQCVIKIILSLCLSAFQEMLTHVLCVAQCESGTTLDADVGACTKVG